MLCAIELENGITIQGEFVETLPDGRMKVRVGSRCFSGVPSKYIAKAA